MENRSSLGFFEFIGKFSFFVFFLFFFQELVYIDFWIWFIFIILIMKVDIDCCMITHISYLVKLWFLIYWPKCSFPIRSQDFYINSISRTNWWKSLFFRYKFFGIKSWMKSGHKCVFSFWSQDSKIVAISHEEINGINWFLVCWYKFRKAWSYFNNWTLVLRGSYKITLVFAILSVHQFTFFSGMAHYFFSILARR